MMNCLKKVEKPRKRGRPPKWVGERKKKAQDIILRETQKGLGIRTICKNFDVPNINIIYDWILHDNLFNDCYIRAKQIQADVLVEKALELCEEILKESREKEVSYQTLKAVDMLVNTRKWYAAKLAPKLYGNRIIEERTTEKPIQSVKLVFPSSESE